MVTAYGSVLTVKTVMFPQLRLNPILSWNTTCSHSCFDDKFNPNIKVVLVLSMPKTGKPGMEGYEGDLKILDTKLKNPPVLGQGCVNTR